MIDTMIFSATAGKDTNTLLWQTSENSSVIFKQNKKDGAAKIDIPFSQQKTLLPSGVFCFPKELQFLFKINYIYLKKWNKSY